MAYGSFRMKRSESSFAGRVGSVLLIFTSTVAAWGGNKYGSQTLDMTMFQQNDAMDWLNNYDSLEIKYNGCVWFDVNKGGDENGGGCYGYNGDDRKRRLGDGDVPWFMLANCKIAQVVYSVYGTESGKGSCGRGKYLDTFVTNGGIGGFATLLSTYSSNSPLSYSDTQYLPQCEYSDDGYYHAVGCSGGGDFVIDAFEDMYCTVFAKSYEKLSSINSKLKSVGCSNCHGSGNSGYNSLCTYLLISSDVCSPVDSEFCKKVSGKSLSDYTVNRSSKNGASRGGVGSSVGVFVTKLKFVMGFGFLTASVIMFMGIMYTNRRKRRALMHRKFRNTDPSKSSRRGNSLSSLDRREMS